MWHLPELDSLPQLRRHDVATPRVLVMRENLVVAQELREQAAILRNLANFSQTLGTGEALGLYKAAEVLLRRAAELELK